MEAVDLKRLLEDIAGDAAFEALGRGVHIDLRAEETCHLQGARDLLHSAFENVLRNALRYTDEDTTVTVELQCSRSSVSVTVSDQGPGIPEQDLVHVFEPFYRVAKARDRQSGGTGLGLAITDRTVRLHGGSVEAFNRFQGRPLNLHEFSGIPNSRRRTAAGIGCGTAGVSRTIRRLGLSSKVDPKRRARLPLGQHIRGGI